MPDIYQSGQPIPELQGTIHQGVTIVIHDPSDVLSLLALCALAPTPPQDPIDAIANTIKAPDFNLRDWLPWGYRQGVFSAELIQDLENAWRHETQESREDDWSLLRQSLLLAVARWMKNSDDVDNLALVFSVHDPEAGSNPTMTWNSEQSLLLFHKGSLLVEIVKGITNPARFGVALVSLVLPGGISPRKRIQKAVKRQREKDIQQIRRKDPQARVIT
jgi:hypothetical protein